MLVRKQRCKWRDASEVESKDNTIASNTPVLVDTTVDKARDSSYGTPFTRTKYSYGIACIRKNINIAEKIADCGIKYEILMVRKKYTYAYFMFVVGKYNSNNNREMIELFNKMTLEEKLDIRSLSYLQIWYRVYLDKPIIRVGNRPNPYFQAKLRFETAFLVDGGARLHRLLASATQSSDLLWEIPKGHKKSRHEPDLACAMREFVEETQIGHKSYRIMPQSRSYSFIDDNVRYINTYYFAQYTARTYKLPNIMLNQPEVSAIRWMDMDSARILCGRRVWHFMRMIVKIAKKELKK